MVANDEMLVFMAYTDFAAGVLLEPPSGLVCPRVGAAGRAW